ncbi:MAG: hypothetical protein JST89_15355 [Cyanobacteria bacterium SZAS-4]|nr:hypothetical protein [Cyanobacteria bacterium SZAS-4]
MKTQATRSLSLSPDVALIENLLTEQQCLGLVQLGQKHGVEPLAFKDNPIVQKVGKSLAAQMNVPVEKLGALSIHRLDHGDQAESSPSFPNLQPTSSNAGIRQTITVLLALNDTESGGEVIFPSANLTIPLTKGSALIIRNFKDDAPDPQALHGFMPAAGRDKWVAVVHLCESLSDLNAATEPPQECPMSGMRAAAAAAAAAAASSDKDAPVPLAQPEKFDATTGGTIRVWRLHPEGAKITPADKSLMGDAPTGALRWCGPFTHANAYGFWVYPPLDIDIIWHGGRSFEYEIIHGYSHADYDHMHGLQQPGDSYQYGPREKIDAGTVFEGIFSIWTGCAFQTPPGWALMIRSVINKPVSPVFKIQEGILETDWLAYDIWMNLQFVQQNKKVSLRRGNVASPIAQIVPVPRQAYDSPWELTESMMERSTPEGEKFYQSWAAYNYKKWVKNAHKEPSTYSTERARYFKDERQSYE